MARLLPKFLVARPGTVKGQMKRNVRHAPRFGPQNKHWKFFWIDFRVHSAAAPKTPALSLSKSVTKFRAEEYLHCHTLTPTGPFN